MKINFKPMGSYQTNCYIIENDGKEIIIDPGVDATSWVKENVKNPVAILNTHGHFDHVWSNSELKKEFNIPLYCPKDDAFMLQSDPHNMGMIASTPDVEVCGDEVFELAGLKVEFIHFPGHTPGCSIIKISDIIFSGDFVFKGSIGRVDFPYSSPEEMKMSIKKFMSIKENLKVYPGHGTSTTVKEEQNYLPLWLERI